MARDIPPGISRALGAARAALRNRPIDETDWDEISEVIAEKVRDKLPSVTEAERPDSIAPLRRQLQRVAIGVMIAAGTAATVVLQQCGR